MFIAFAGTPTWAFRAQSGLHGIGNLTLEHKYFFWALRSKIHRKKSFSTRSLTECDVRVFESEDILRQDSWLQWKRNHVKLLTFKLHRQIDFAGHMNEWKYFHAVLAIVKIQ